MDLYDRPHPTARILGLTDDALYEEYRYSDYVWQLNGDTILHGTLTHKQLRHFAETLDDTDILRGYHELYGTRFEQHYIAVVQVTRGSIRYFSGLQEPDDEDGKIPSGNYPYKRSPM